MPTYVSIVQLIYILLFFSLQLQREGKSYQVCEFVGLCVSVHIKVWGHCAKKQQEALL